MEILKKKRGSFPIVTGKNKKETNIQVVEGVIFLLEYKGKNRKVGVYEVAGKWTPTHLKSGTRPDTTTFDSPEEAAKYCVEKFETNMEKLKESKFYNKCCKIIAEHNELPF